MEEGKQKGSEIISLEAAALEQLNFLYPTKIVMFDNTWIHITVLVALEY